MERKKREELYETSKKLCLGVSAADDAVAGEGRTDSYSDQQRSSRHPQLVVYVAVALSGTRGSSLCANAGLSKPT